MLTQKFIPSAADCAIRAYRETKQFIEYADSLNQNDILDKNERPVSRSENAFIENQSVAPLVNPLKQLNENFSEEVEMRRAIFALSEGDVTISFPKKLSGESVSDLASYLEIFLKKAKREASEN